MKKNYFAKFINFFLVTLILLSTIAAVAISKFDVYQINNNISISSSSGYLNPPMPISAELRDENGFLLHTQNEQITDKDVSLEYKLFGMIPLKKIDCSVLKAENNSAYLGGFPLGIKMQSNQMVINSKVSVVTAEGLVCPFEKYDIKFGDILYSVNNIRIDSVETLNNVINQLPSMKAKVVILRGNSQMYCDISIAFDCIENVRKLGLMLQDNISGLGTMTFIDCNSGRYGALGHPVREITDSSGKQKVSGKIYNAQIYGAIAGEKGKAGELNGNFLPNSDSLIGSIISHSSFGIFGDYCGSVNNLQKIEYGDRYSVVPGKAHIYSSVGDGVAQKYEIEIVKVSNQNAPKDKGMVIKVTDKKLLALSGGIVQGMSGSPIVQNNKLIGAVTHVFLNDPTRGYGLFVDWMR